MFSNENSYRSVDSFSVGNTQHNVLNLFVGGLNKSTSEAELFHYFAEFGDVSHVEIARSPNGKSKGYGYVVYLDPVGQQNALQVEPHVLQGFCLRVEPAHGSEFRQTQHMQLAERRLYLSGIPSTATQTEICRLLTNFGNPVSVTNLRRSNPYSNPNSFYCYVTMDSSTSAQRILAANCLVLSSGVKVTAKAFESPNCKKKSYLNSWSGPSGPSKFQQNHHEFLERRYKCQEDKSISTLGSPATPLATGRRVMREVVFNQADDKLCAQFGILRAVARQNPQRGLEKYLQSAISPGAPCVRIASCTQGRFWLPDSGLSHGKSGLSGEENLRFNISRHPGPPKSLGLNQGPRWFQ